MIDGARQVDVQAIYGNVIKRTLSNGAIIGFDLLPLKLILNATVKICRNVLIRRGYWDDDSTNVPTHFLTVIGRIP